MHDSRTRWIALAAVVLLAAAVSVWIAGNHGEPSDEHESIVQKDDAVPAASLRGSPRVGRPRPDPESRTRTPRAPPSTETLKVRGFVVCAELDAVTSGALVLAMEEAFGVVGRALTREDGSFDLDAIIRPEAETVTLVARHVRNGLASLPWHVNVQRSRKHAVTGLLLMRPGGTVSGQVIDVDGHPRGDVQVQISELPDTKRAAPATWELQYSVENMVLVRTDEDGRFQGTVRAGPIVLRTRAGDGTRGPRLHATVEAGRDTDVGSVTLDEGGQDLVVEVVDRRGQPIPQAWIQLDDRTLRHGQVGAVSSLPNFLTDDAGRLRISGLGTSCWPLVLAAGSQRHEARAISISDSASEVTRIELEDRPGFDLVIRDHGRTEGDHLRAILRKVSWSIVKTPRTPSADLADMRAPDEMIAGVLQANCAVPADGLHSRFQAYVREEGSYHVVGAVPGGASITAVASASRPPRPSYALDLPPGRILTLRGRVPEAFHGNLRLFWGAGSKEYTSVSAQTLRMGFPSYVPDRYTEVVIRSSPGSLLTLTSHATKLPSVSGAHVEISVLPDEVPVPVRIQLLGGGAVRRLVDWPIWVVRADGGGVTLRADARGMADLLVRPGRYKAIALRRVGPEQWIEFEAMGRDHIQSLPVW